MKLYVEGGGEFRDLQIRCRKAFSKLLERAGLQGRMPRIVACGSRRQAYERFCMAHRSPSEPDAAMLVDSETPVELPPWDHLRQQDGWDRPDGAEDWQAQMMVTCMETWIAADREALGRVFGSRLRVQRLPAPIELERRSRDEIQFALEAATRDCPGPYTKGARSFQALEQLSPAVLEPLLPHFRRLLEALRSRE